MSRKPQHPHTQTTTQGAHLPPAGSESALEFMWQAFGNLNEWVRFSDTKAAAVLAADGVLIGALTTVLTGNRPHVLASTLALIWICAVILAAFYSAAYALASLLPQLRVKPKSSGSDETSSVEEASSLVFFADIDKAYPSAAKFHDTVRKALQDPERAVTEISHQVWANSKVAAVKYGRVTKSVSALLVAVYLGCIGVISLGISLIIRSINGG